MATDSKKLQYVFNKYADKLIDMQELSALTIQECSAQLSRTEAAQVMTEATNPTRLAKGMEATLELLVNSAMEGNPIEIFQSDDGRQFTTLKTFKKLDEALQRIIPTSLSAALVKKADDAAADAVIKAKDYAGKKKALGLKPIF